MDVHYTLAPYSAGSLVVLCHVITHGKGSKRMNVPFHANIRAVIISLKPATHERPLIGRRGRAGILQPVTVMTSDGGGSEHSRTGTAAPDHTHRYPRQPV